MSRNNVGVIRILFRGCDNGWVKRAREKGDRGRDVEGAVRYTRDDRRVERGSKAPTLSLVYATHIANTVRVNIFAFERIYAYVVSCAALLAAASGAVIVLSS